MKVLFVITGLAIGGAERQVIDIADRLFDLGHHVTIVYLTGPVLMRPNSDGISILGLDMKKSLIGFIHAYLKLRSLIQSYSPDVVHSHMVHANLLARVVRISCAFPKLICTAHNSNEGGWLRMFCYRLTNWLADVTTNVSAEAVARFESIGAVKLGGMITLHNGINTRRFQPSLTMRNKIRKLYDVQDEEKVIIAVGRLTPAKDYPNLLVAFANILQSISNVRLWIIGEGDLLQELVAHVARLNIGNRITFLGAQTNVENWINASDVFALSSAWEGFGLVVAEAMACEKVVVATDSGGVKEVIGDCGFLVPKNDSHALFLALKQAVLLPDSKAKAIGIKAHNRIICNYSINHAVERLLQLYLS